ncbi:MAG: conjugal transfer protein TraX [Lachnospiraceae bacterium]
MRLNSFQLKWIAIITMLIDHVGAVLFPYEIGLRIIGRIAFPIFCFLIVEGFSHTRNVRRYMARLGIFAVLSEVPYDLAFHGKLIDTTGQNVFFTLLLGVLLMYLMEKTPNIFIKALEIFLIFCTAELLETDYSGRGVLLILIYYVFRRWKEIYVCAGAAWNFLYGWGMVQNFGVFSAPFIALYNGERGPKIKYFFYVFYPAHLLILHFCYCLLCSQ